MILHLQRHTSTQICWQGQAVPVQLLPKLIRGGGADGRVRPQWQAVPRVEGGGVDFARGVVERLGHGLGHGGYCWR